MKSALPLPLLLPVALPLPLPEALAPPGMDGETDNDPPTAPPQLLLPRALAVGMAVGLRVASALRVRVGEVDTELDMLGEVEVEREAGGVAERRGVRLSVESMLKDAAPSIRSN